MPFKRPLGVAEQKQTAPNFIRPLQDKRVVVGQQVVLECQVEAQPDPAIKWLKDGQNVSQCPDYELSQDGNRYRLTVISGAQVSDGGRFTCQALNAAGSKTTSCMLIVAPAPSPVPGAKGGITAPSPAPPATPIGPTAPMFVKELKHQPLKIGGSVGFECRVIGNPLPKISWMKNGKSLGAMSRYKVENRDETGICSLELSMVRSEDVAEYSCRAVNPHGQAETRAQVMHKDAYDKWLAEEQTLITREKKKTMMDELESVHQQPPQKQPGKFYRPKTERQLDQRLAAQQQQQSDVDSSDVGQWMSESETEPELAALGDGGPPSPPQIKSQLRSLRLTEGTDAILQAAIIGNPKPKIKWLKDGRPLAPSGNRYSMTYKGSMVVLKIKMVFQEDAGQYMVVAENKHGQISSTAILEVVGFQDPQQQSPPQKPQGRQFGQQRQQQQAPQQPQQQQQMQGGPAFQQQQEQQPPQPGGPRAPPKPAFMRRPETASPQQQLAAQQHQQQYQQQQQQTPQYARSPMGKPPAFQRHPQSVQKRQGEAAEFVAKVTGDPPPTLDWFKSDGSRIEPSSKYAIGQTADGSVVFRINDVSAQDADTYCCVAQNSGGSFQSRCSLSVLQEVVAKSAPPQFVGKFQSVTVFAGDSLTLYCKAVGEGVTMIWAKDGKQLASEGNIVVKTTGGESTLQINAAKESDAGWYQCNASNSAGTSVLRGLVVVQSKQQQQQVVQQQHQQQQQQLQAQQEAVYLKRVPRKEIRYGSRQEEDLPPPSQELPRFTGELKAMSLTEGQAATFQSQFTPVDDPNLKVAWLLNGKPIDASSRISTVCQFGVAVLEINPVQPQDSGTYTCMAVNSKGEAQLSTQLEVKGTRSILTSGPASSTMNQIEYLEARRQQQLNQRGGALDDTVSLQRPNFILELRNVECVEGRPAHFEAKLTPHSDPNLKVEWLFNGKTLPTGSRFRTLHDFGFVACDISHTIAEDSGQYTCRAINQLGTTETSGTLVCAARQVAQAGAPEDVDRDTLLDVHGQVSARAPAFLTQLRECEARELGRAHFEARVVPQGDPYLRVDWLKDGQPLKMANRIQMHHDFGFVSLTFGSTFPEDEGLYTCVLTNGLGKAESSAALRCNKEQSLSLGTQHYDSLQQIGYLEGQQVHIGPVSQERPEEFQSMSEPKFARPLQDAIEVNENQSVHLECRLIPAQDPKMSIQWFHNGKPLAAAHRFRPMYDFGYVALDILYAYPEDSGTYTVVAKNQLGTAQTDCKLAVGSKKSLYLDAQHPEGLERIEQLERNRGLPGRTEEPDRGCAHAPKFIGQLRDQNLLEGTNMHFEIKVEPVNDPTMQIEWYRDGRPILTGSRARMNKDFGFLTLDLLGVIAEDSGQYTVKAVNAKGDVGASALLIVQPKNAILSDTQHMESLGKIQYLESRDKFGRPEIVDSSDKSAPTFVQGLPAEIPVVPEASNLHLECQVTPVSDNTMRIDWFRNGQPVPAGHRFRTFNDFGFVSLDILTIYPEDSGLYSCVAKNSAGQAITECNVSCEAKSAIQGQTQHPSSVQRIREIETPKAPKPETPAPLRHAPKFIRKLQHEGIVTEGKNVHVECQYQPVDDPTLVVEWYKHDYPLMTSHRFRTTNDFGFCALTIVGMISEDSGMYKCVVRNSAGEDQTEVAITCNPDHNIFMNSNHPASLQRIVQLEAPRQAAAEIEEGPKEPPRFTQSLPEILENLKEAQTLHLEAQILPIDDPTVFVEWFFNNKPVKASHRFHFTNNFGYIALDITHMYPEDTGVFSVKVKSATGEVESKCNVTVIQRKHIYTETQHPESWKRIKEIEERKPIEVPEEERKIVPPRFVQELTTPENVNEGQGVHMECLIEPIDDPDLKLQWFFNDKPLKFASRFRVIAEFGYVGMEIYHIHPEDTGTYTCKAINKAGEATTSCKIECAPKRSLYLDPANVMAWQRVQELEAPGPPKEPSPERTFPPPTFTVPLQNADGLQEGDAVRLECRLVPVDDPTLKVHWERNGQPIPQASRFMPARNMDYISLDLLTVYGEDSGVYSCKAVSEFGDAVTSCTVKCQSKDSLLLDTQHQESWVQIQEIENRKPVEPIVAEPDICAPRFVVQLPADFAQIAEGTPLHMECQVEPTNDNKLEVQWFFNDRPITNAHRFRTTHDFGYCSLDILYAFPEDTGKWSCRAKNQLGKAETSASVDVASRLAILSDTQHPQSWQRIQEIEAPKPAAPMVADKPKEQPAFVEAMTDQERIEGQPAHFETRFTPVNDNEVKVTWFKDGRPLAMANRFRHTADFGFISLDIGHTLPEDDGEYTVKVVNRVGQASQSAKLSVQARDAILRGTQHPTSWEKIQILEEPKQPAPDVQKAPAQAPKFQTQLNSVLNLIEGQPAHFEATLLPTDDPNLEIYWFQNDRPLAASSRISMHHDFGLVTLDLHYCLPEDVGVFTCLARNAAGQDTTAGELECAGRASIYKDTLHQKSWDKIKIIEMPKEPPPPSEPQVFQKPQFTEPPKNVDDATAGSQALLEARVIPVNDPNLRIEWYLNDKPLFQTNRHAMSHDFGHVSLLIRHVLPHDAGMYMCRAVNELGESVASCSLSVASERGIQSDSQHPESHRKIIELEALDKFPRKEIEDKVFEKPTFVETLQNLDDLKEGQVAHLECHVEPVGDPTMKIEWTKNDRPLHNANRFRMEYDFGKITLDIIHVFPEDSGVYSCRAVNKAGEATTSASVKIEGYENILKDTQHPVSWQRIQDLERPVIKEEIEPVVEKQKPQITVPPENIEDIPEGQPIHLEVQYEPKRDSSLKVAWLKNGQKIGAASQLIKAKTELGYASLDISTANPDHEGLYTVQIVNSEGEAAASATVKVLGSGAILGATQHEESWKRIQEIEAPKEAAPDAPAPVYEAPSFVSPLTDAESTEGDQVHFECQVQPANDPNMKFVWMRNGQALSAGSKYAMQYDFGMCILDIAYAFPEDSGVYQLKVINAAGEAVTSGTLKCEPKDKIITVSQVGAAGAAKIAELEAPKQPPPEMPELPKQPPVFTAEIQDLGDLYEGQAAHFEGTVEPIDDNTLKVEWYLNDQLMSASSRLKMINDFGWIIADIGQVEPRDTGEWVCRAYNTAGEAFSRGRLNVIAKDNIIYDAQQPQSLPRIQELEAAKLEAVAPEPKPAEVPKFVVNLAEQGQLSEGDSVHLEAQVTPTDDNKLKIEWFKNGRPLPFASRFRPISDFGFCILDILHVLPEDTGEYVCRAVNEAGYAETSVKLQCSPKSGLILHPQVKESKAKAIDDLEEALHRKPEEVDVPFERRAPIFVEPLQNPPPLLEGENIHFAAKFEPTNDNEVKVEWYVNGRLLKDSSRVKTVSDFGYAILEIAPVYAEDSGEYVCRAYNSVGEATTRADMKCEPKLKIISTSQLPSNMSGAQAKIAEIEAPKPQPDDMPEAELGPPRFVTNLQDNVGLVEGMLMHFECQLEPANDPHIRVEWFHNDKAISHSSRIKTIHDFGFVIMEISPAEPQDTGVWVCNAKNRFGEAMTQANIQVEGRGGIAYEWQMPAERRERITALEDWLNRPPEDATKPPKDFGPPKFIAQLPDLGELNEADDAHFEAQIEPIGDPTMRIEWLHNGRSIPFSNRIQQQLDFGIVSLDVKYLLPHDSGEYTCKISNSKGSATSVGKVVARSLVATEEPKIVVPLLERIEGIMEGELVHFECRVSPINDPKLRMQWFFNGKPLKDASRFKTCIDFGFVTLDILYAYPEDSGKYTLQAVNDKGQASTTAELVVGSKPKLIFRPQAPANTAGDDVQRHLMQYTRSDVVLKADDQWKDGMQMKPEFKSQLNNLGVEEGEYGRFECQLAPVNDPYMTVEWMHNGVPIMLGHRYRSTLDYGFAALDVLFALPEDTGEYTCVAKNPFGTATTKGKLACAPMKRVITESQLPQGMTVASLKKLEDQLYWAQKAEAAGGQPTPKSKCPPIFTIPPRPVQSVENEPARFECTVSGNPKPKVTWYINGAQAVSGNRYKLHYDGMHYFTIPQTRTSDAGEVVVVARNPLGETMAQASLDIFLQRDFRYVQLKPALMKTGDELQDREQRWKEEWKGDLGTAFKQVPKPDVQKLHRVEREKTPPQSLETPELIDKFTKPKDQLSEKIANVERRPEFPGVELPPVQLRPSSMSRYQPPIEEMERVQLKSAAREERPEPSGANAEIPWQQPKRMSDQQQQQKFRVGPPVPKEVDVPAKDQVRLRGQKPKPAAEYPEAERVQLEQPGKVVPPQQMPEVPKEEPVPAADQVKLKSAYRPKPAKATAPEPLEAPSLKQTQIPDKKEEQKTQISTKAMSFYQHEMTSRRANGSDGDDVMGIAEKRVKLTEYSEHHRDEALLRYQAYHMVRPTPQKLGQSAKQPPSISDQLQPVQAELGRPAKFHCAFSGARPLTVVWLKNGQIISSSFDFQIKTDETGSRLELAKVKREHAGEYTVRIQNVAGKVESTANLQVLDRADVGSAPNFSKVLSDATVVQGRPVQFDVGIVGQPIPSVTWFKDGKAVTAAARFKMLIDKDQVSLLILETTPGDSGTYECVLRNAKGEARCKANLTVPMVKGTQPDHAAKREGPRFTEQIQPVVVEEGASARFQAKITGNPEPTLRWYRNNEPIKKSKFFEQTQSAGVCSLDIKECFQEDVGEYKCEATNPAGKAVTIANLVLKPKGAKIVAKKTTTVQQQGTQ